MSTDLYGIRVLAVDPENRRTRLRVFVVYYDTAVGFHSPLPDDASFFLRALWDKSGDGLCGEISSEQICDESFVDANTYRYVERYERLATRNYPFRNHEDYLDFYYEQDGRWQDEEKLVQADYDLVVTDAKYISYLEEGMSWGTTAYPTRADRISPSEAAFLPDPRRPLLEFDVFIRDQIVDVYSAVFSDDGTLLAISEDYGEWVVYAVNGWREIFRHNSGFSFPSIRFYPGSHQVLITGFRGEQMTWDLDSKTQLATVPLAGCLHSRTGRYLVDYNGDDENLYFLNPDGTTTRVLATGQNVLEAVAFTPDEELVATGGMHNTVKLWETASGRLVNTFTVGERVYSLAFSGDGSYLVIVCDHNLEILRLRDGVFVCQVEFDDYLGQLAYSPDNRYLVVADIRSKRDRRRKVAVFAAGYRYGQ